MTLGMIGLFCLFYKIFELTEFFDHFVKQKKKMCSNFFFFSLSQQWSISKKLTEFLLSFLLAATSICSFK